MQRMHNGPVSEVNACERNTRNFKLFKIPTFPPQRYDPLVSMIDLANQRRNFL